MTDFTFATAELLRLLLVSRNEIYGQFHTQFVRFPVMSFTINILLLNGRRRIIKISPNAIISQTLEDICKREGYSAEKHSFLFQRKILDESLSWRYSNIPNNAKLELVPQEKSKQESPVRIALQYGDGSRLQGTFEPSVILTDILNYWKEELSCVKDDQCEPCIVYLRQEIFGHSKLSTTTLKSLGITSGSAIMRLYFKRANNIVGKDNEKNVHIDSPPSKIHSDVKFAESNTAKPISIPQKLSSQTPPAPQATPTNPMHSANSKLGIITHDMLSTALTQVSNDRSDDINPSTLPESIEVASTSHANRDQSSENGASANSRVRPGRPVSREIPQKRAKSISPPETQPDFSDFKFPEETAGMNLYSPVEDDSYSIAPLMEPCDRNEILFDEKQAATDRPVTDSDDPGDEFFELTIHDIRRMISDLRSFQNESNEKPLSSSHAREMKRFRAINQYPKIIIRIVFPNRKILQGFFRPAEKIQVLYDFVTQFLSTPKPNYFLYTTPPKVVLGDKNSILYDCNLCPASKVYLGLDDGEFDAAMFSPAVRSITGTASDADMRLGDIFQLKSPQRPSDEALAGKNGMCVCSGLSTLAPEVVSNDALPHFWST